MTNEEFSEFSYGFAVTADLLFGRGVPVTAAPVFPSLPQEGQPGVGYDVQMDRRGVPLFLQFKLPHRMVMRTAREYRDRGFPIPCYRMYLRPASISSQHQSLMDLESTGNEVYYVAPLFHTRADLDSSFRNRRVWSDSFRARPGDIGPLPDGRPHHVSYCDAVQWIFMSDEVHREGHGVSVAEFTTTMIKRLRDPALPARAEDVLVDLDQKIRHLVRERRSTRTEWQEVDIDAFEVELKPMERLAYLTQRLFDCQLFIVSEKQQ